MNEHEFYGEHNVEGALYGCLLGTFLLAVVASVVLLCGCSPRVIERVVKTTDTAYVEKNVHDSVYIQDSVYIYEWLAGDTVHVEKEKWHTKWRERIVRDTAYISKRDTVVTVRVQEVPRKLTLWQKGQMWTGRMAIVLIAVAVLWLAIKKSLHSKGL